MGGAVTTPDEFATAMQQLSAEASKSLPGTAPGVPAGNHHPSPGAGALVERLSELEQSLTQKIQMLGERLSRSHDVDLAGRFAKIEEQLAAIRNTDRMNQRLVDSLHEELIKYRDNFLHDSLQKPFIHDLVHLFDDLSALAEQLRNASEQKGAKSRLAPWRENLENAIHSLVEILHRLGVKEIEPKETLDRAFHKVVSFEPAEFAEEDGRIIMRVKRGFVWRGKLIRPEEVIAKRFR